MNERHGEEGVSGNSLEESGQDELGQEDVSEQAGLAG